MLLKLKFKKTINQNSLNSIKNLLKLITHKLKLYLKIEVDVLKEKRQFLHFCYKSFEYSSVT